MSNINIQDFEATITHLVNAGVKDNSKGKPMENWIMANFEAPLISKKMTIWKHRHLIFLKIFIYLFVAVLVLC